MMKKILAYFLVILIGISSLSLISCSRDEEESTPEADGLKRQMKREENDFDDSAYDNEEDGVDLNPIQHKEEDFIGTWNAPSDRAQYLYGNVNLKIKDDGTWSGKITDEKFSGKWKYNGTGITIKDNEGIINWQLFYNADGTLMFKDMDEPEDAIVLKPGPGSN